MIQHVHDSEKPTRTFVLVIRRVNSSYNFRQLNGANLPSLIVVLVTIQLQVDAIILLWACTIWSRIK